MDTAIPFLFTTIIIIILSVFLLKTTTKPRTPPGPWKLPLIGNLHQLISSMEKPHQGITQLAKKYGDLMHLQLGNMSVLIVSSHQAATEVMKTHDLAFADRADIYIASVRPDSGKVLVASKYDQFSKQFRRILLSELSSPKRVQSFSSIREEEGLNLVESIRSSSGSEINLTEKMMSCAGDIFLRAACGCKSKDQSKLLSLTYKMVEEASKFSLVEMFPWLEFVYGITGLKAKFVKIQEQGDEIIQDIIKNRPEHENENLLDVLLRVQKSGNQEVPVTDGDIKTILWEAYTGSTINLTPILTWAMAEMIRNPNIMEKAQSEVRQVLKGKEIIDESDFRKLNYLKQVIMETERLHASLPLIHPRESREKCEIKGYEIPNKTKVIINLWAIGRDSKYWNNPEYFIPERFSNGNLEYIPFGAGRRMCPGATYASINIEFILAKLLYHFDWKLPGGMKPHKLDMTEVYGSIAKKKNDLVVIATPYDAQQV